MRASPVSFIAAATSGGVCAAARPANARPAASPCSHFIVLLLPSLRGAFGCVRSGPERAPIRALRDDALERGEPGARAGRLARADRGRAGGERAPGRDHA